MAIRADRVGVRQDQVDVHGRVTSPSFLNELLEDLPEWTDMPVWVNGTEEVLPSNTSVPVTSPILADIVYPDIRRDNQYFTYRESPTPVDGLAKIKSIKGNTLLWNQVAPAMNSSVWVANRCTKTVSGNTFSLVGTESTSSSFGVYIALANLKLTVNHDYLFMCVVNANRGIQVRFTFDRDGRYTTITPNQDNVYARVVSTATEDPVVCYISHPSSITTSDTVTVKNLMIVDLTMLNDSRIMDFNTFKAYYPLDYYDFNAGTLLSFNGTGIKTVGRNLFDESLISQVADIGYVQIYVGDGTFEISTTTPNNGQANVFLLSGYATSGASTANNGAWDGRTRRVVSNNGYVTVATRTAGTPLINPKDYETILYKYNGETVPYEPYVSHTTNLPIATYFPTGMKSAGTVYDELTPTKAITRIGAVDLGSLEWESGGTNTQDIMRMKCISLRNIISKPSSAIVSANVMCINYTTVSAYDTYIKTVGVSVDSVGDILVYDPNYNTPTSAGEFKTAMSGVYLYYELATPVELPTMSFE